MDTDFCVVILTHNRPTNIKTYQTLRRQNYSGQIYILVDDRDPSIDDYKRIYPDELLVFSKDEAKQYTDTMDTTGNMKVVVFARNAVFNKIKKETPYEYFIVLDDDYTGFHYTFNRRFKYACLAILSLDSIFSELVAFYKNNNNIASLGILQGGDFIGGKENKNALKANMTRKIMNFFLCSTNRPFTFMGSINEDANAYVSHQHAGRFLFLSLNQLRLNQSTTQQNSGGLTDVYLELGTYVKSFYTVMLCPSAVTIKSMGDKHYRLHHSISERNAYPKIMRVN
jgi:hypothetical protein